MLLQEKMETTDFSPSEQIVVSFILEKQELIQNYTTTAIAGETYVSPSILVRISKKLGFNGFNDFKKAFLEEVSYLKTNFQNLDANQPFSAKDSIMTIAASISALKHESLKDTMALLHHDSLQKAVLLLQKARTIKVFTISNLTFVAEEFVFKLRHIGLNAETYSISNTMIQEAYMTAADTCAICISYSGESPELLLVTKALKKNHIPIIAISSVGENSLTRMGNVVLQLATRERSYSKIGAFSSLESLSLILDILYSCLFKTGYDRHYAYKVKLSKTTEFRVIDNSIIQENDSGGMFE